MIYDEDDIIEIPTIGSVKAGDTVMVALRNGEPTAIGVVGEGDEKSALIAESIDLSATAKAIAEATGQHFWHDDNGAHVTELEQDDFLANPRGGHILMNSLGILFERDGQQLAFYGSTATQIGATDDAHVALTPRLMQLVDANGTPFFSAGDLRDDDSAYITLQQEFEIEEDGSYTLNELPAAGTPVTATKDGVSVQVAVSGQTVTFPTVTDGTVVVTYKMMTTAPYYFLVNGNVNSASNIVANGYVTSGNYMATSKSGNYAANYLNRTDLSFRRGVTPPSADTYGAQLLMRDKDKKTNAFMRSRLTTANVLSADFGCRRYDSSNSSYLNNGLYLSIDNDGKRAVGVTESAPWRKALGFGETFSDAFSAVSHGAMIYGHGTSQTLTTSGTAYKVNLTTISRHDPNGLFELSNNGIKIKKGGRYLICGQAYFQSVSAGGYIQVEIHENNDVIPQSVSFVRINGATSTANTGMLMKNVTEGDTLYLYAQSSTAKAVLPASSNGFYLTAIYLG